MNDYADQDAREAKRRAGMAPSLREIADAHYAETNAAAESACTPRCASLHAIDCPRYSGPLSATGSLSRRDLHETTGGTW